MSKEKSPEELIGSTIKKLRKSKGITQTELAKMTNISYSSIQKYEQGIVFPSLDMIKSIASALGVRKEEILEPVFSSDLCDGEQIAFAYRFSRANEKFDKEEEEKEQKELIDKFDHLKFMEKQFIFTAMDFLISMHTEE